MKKTHLILLLFIGLSSILNAQDYKTIDATIIKDESISYSSKVIMPDNSYEFSYRITVLKKKSFSESSNLDTIFYPKDIKGFILENGQKYISEDILINNENVRVFLEEIIKDSSIAVYSYESNEKNVYYFMRENNNSIMPIDANAEPFKTYLQNNIPLCDNLSKETFDKIKPKTNDILNSYKAFKNCNSRYLLRKTRIGVTLGYNLSQLADDKNIPREGDNDKAATFGIFVDIPLAQKQFSVRPEIFYQKESYSNSMGNYVSEKEFTNTNYFFKRESLVIPVLIRYTNIGAKYKESPLPYIEAGVVGAYSLNSEYKAVSEIVGSQGYYNHLEDTPSKLYYGLAVGAGLEFLPFNNHPLYIGVRYIYTSNGNFKTNNILFSAAIGIF